MKVYWDTSAIICYFGRGRIREIRGVTRPHTLSETFSALTGGGFELVMPDGTKKHRRLSLRALPTADRLCILHSRPPYQVLPFSWAVSALEDGV